MLSWKIKKKTEDLLYTSVVCKVLRVLHRGRENHIYFHSVLLSSGMFLGPNLVLGLVAETFVVVTFDLEQLLEVGCAEEGALVGRECVHSGNITNWLVKLRN